MGSFVSLRDASQLEVSGISLLGEFRSSLLGLVDIVVNALDAAVGLRVLTLLETVKISKAVDFILIPCSLFFKLAKLESQVVDVLAKGITSIALLGDITLRSKNLTFSS